MTAAIRHAARIANDTPRKYRSKAATATSGPTLSAAAREGRQSHHTNPSGIKAHTHGMYQKLGAPNSDASVKQTPPIMIRSEARTRVIVRFNHIARTPA